jgi:hypothetical protein
MSAMAKRLHSSNVTHEAPERWQGTTEDERQDVDRGFDGLPLLLELSPGYPVVPLQLLVDPAGLAQQVLVDRRGRVRCSFMAFTLPPSVPPRRSDLVVVLGGIRVAHVADGTGARSGMAKV